MASSVQNVKITGIATYVPARTDEAQAYETAYRENRHRIYSLAFWLTNNEMAAEELMGDAFRRAFSLAPSPDAEAIDRALLSEARELIPIGVLTLECSPAAQVLNVRRNTLRVHLENAVVQVPATERLIFLMHDAEGYDHSRIARTLGITEDESRQGLHQARLRIRDLVSSMS